MCLKFSIGFSWSFQSTSYPVTYTTNNKLAESPSQDDQKAWDEARPGIRKLDENSLRIKRGNFSSSKDNFSPLIFPSFFP